MNSVSMHYKYFLVIPHKHKILGYSDFSLNWFHIGSYMCCHYIQSYKSKWTPDCYCSDFTKHASHAHSATYYKEKK